MAAPPSVELAREGLSLLLRVLNPVVPHVTHALWQDLGYAAKHGDIVDAAWPKVDQAALAQDEIELVLQVNGKLKGKLMVAADADKAAIEAAAIASTHVQRALAENHSGGDAEARVERVIVVPNRLVNVVLPTAGTDGGCDDAGPQPPWPLALAIGRMRRDSLRLRWPSWSLTRARAPKTSRCPPIPRRALSSSTRKAPS